MSLLQNITAADIAHVIQLSVAPVFLLAGIGSILGVMANRLARVVDRARILEGRLATAESADLVDLQSRLQTLGKRAGLISRGLALCTLTALLICAVIVMLFFGALSGFNAAIPAALLFIGALLSFAAGLIWFLRENLLGASSLRFGVKR